MSRIKIVLIVWTALSAVLAVATYSSVLGFSEMSIIHDDIQTVQVVDRHNEPLSASYQNRWNSYDHVPLHKVPALLQRAFVLSEDQHFYEHGGIDWIARGSAMWDAIRFRKASRGASTLSEQVVRLQHPRPRTLWSKWIETVEVMRLESQFNKHEILEFYLNQVPYASNRRGVVQAARHYFNRDIDTLNVKETLALVVLARAPSRYDLHKNASGIDAPIERLARRLVEANVLTPTQMSEVGTQKLELARARDPVNAAHFVTYVRTKEPAQHKIYTTLDSELQSKVQGLLDRRVRSMQDQDLSNGAAIVIDHTTGEVLAWVVAGAGNENTPGAQIDAVTTLRQPGSSLKPFLYALALDSGWTDNTIIQDAPLAQTIGEGYHAFANYSHRYYGDVTVRQALGNSLNIPALKTIQFAGVGRYLDTLHNLGFSSLKENASYYEVGLALGSGEVTLFELAQAYAALAQGGVFSPVRVTTHQEIGARHRVFSAQASAAIGDILSDAKARQLEFGANSVQNLPVQTAVKTGTSSDYHDAWAVGYNYRYVVAVWMGNLDRRPTKGVTGAFGPALTLRSVFAELTRFAQTAPLAPFPRLQVSEALPEKTKTSEPHLTMPTHGMQIAIDPRAPRAQQELMMRVSALAPNDRVLWHIDGKRIAETLKPQLSWKLDFGKHALVVTIAHSDGTQTSLKEVAFLVK